MNSPQRIVLITGMSGAGKSQALRFFEDQGYYCVDNLPAALLPGLAELLKKPPQAEKRIVVCIDARSGVDLKTLPISIQLVKEMGYIHHTIFLDSNDRVLRQRYSETRRPHPSSLHGNIDEGIERERALLKPVQNIADLTIDTSDIPANEMRERIATMVNIQGEAHPMAVEVMSFGFKYGLPHEADIVLDVRFLPNPYWDEDLRHLSGMDAEVRDYVINSDETREFFKHAKAMIKYLMPRYEAEPKSFLTIAIGCTGGQHRSVAIAHQILHLLRDLNYEVRLRHRDMKLSSEN
jgi:RNase adapter protein RapZ